MKRAEATLEKIYERDPVTNAYIIAVALEKYADIFNELDPSPFRKRDLDNDLRVFLEDCSSDIPLNQEIILQFNLTNEAQDKEKEERIRQGLKTYFSFTTSLLSSEIRKSYEKSAVYAGVSLVLLFVSYSLRTTIVGNPLYSTLIEGISISGWVFLWEAISTFTFKKRDAKNKRRHYKRFTGAQIRFNYVQKLNP
jgi:hypothetical protein